MEGQLSNMDPRVLSDCFLEVVDRTGNVRERISLGEGALNLGRAYINEIIIDDQYVCPKHARVKLLPDGELLVEDLDSLNGLFSERHGISVPRLLLKPGQVFFIGWTEIRFRDRHGPVVPAHPDHSRHPVLSLFQRKGPLLLIALLTFMVLVMQEWSVQYKPLEWERLVGTPIMIFSGIVVWAFFWAVVSKLVIHRAWFFAHCGIAAAMVGLDFTWGTLVDYAAFTFDLNLTRTILLYTAGFLLFAAGLVVHMRFASRASLRRLIGIAVIISGGFCGTAIAVVQHQSSKFSAQPEYDATLKAPAFVWFNIYDRQGFVSEMKGLKKRVDEARAQQRAQEAERNRRRPRKATQRD